MKLWIDREHDQPWGRIVAFRYQTERRYAWFGRVGFGFGGSEHWYNAHWRQLRHPWRRWSRGDYYWIDFFKQIARGLREFALG